MSFGSFVTGRKSRDIGIDNPKTFIIRTGRVDCTTLSSCVDSPADYLTSVLYLEVITWCAGFHRLSER